MKRNFLVVNNFKEMKASSIKVIEKDNAKGLHSGDCLVMVNTDEQVGSYLIKIDYIVYKEETNLVYFKYIEKLTGRLPEIYWEMFKESENEKNFK